MQSLKPGDVVQLNPEAVRNRAFAGCFMTVTEVHDSWVQGYVQALGESFREAGGAAYYRAGRAEFEGPIGRAIWAAA